MEEIVITKVAVLNQTKAVDVKLSAGIFQQIGDHLPREGASVIDGSDLILTPPFAEAHIHLDTAFAGDEAVNASGCLDEGISNWQAIRPTLTREDMKEKARKVLRKMVGQGVLSFRVMVDVSEGNLTALNAFREVRDELEPWIDLQLIAFPQSGMFGQDDGLDHMKAALEAGADGVSAVPHLEASEHEGEASLEACFELAVAHQAFVHVFADETDDETSCFTESVARLALKHRWSSLTAVSHSNAMEYQDEAYIGHLMSVLKDSGITMVTCPSVNSVMNGRNKPSPKGRGIMRVKELMANGVPVACAHDDFRSPFYPLGSGSLLKAANLLVHLGQLSSPEELAGTFTAITDTPRALMGFRPWKLAPGERADFLLMKKGAVQEWLEDTPAPVYVFRQGQVLVHNPPVRSSVCEALADRLGDTTHQRTMER